MNENMTEKEMKEIRLATIYEMRLLFTQGEKQDYTVQEIVEIFDKMALAGNK